MQCWIKGKIARNEGRSQFIPIVMHCSECNDISSSSKVNIKRIFIYVEDAYRNYLCVCALRAHESANKNI